MDKFQDVISFLYESNAIEDVWDLKSLGKALIAWDYLIAYDQLTVSHLLKTHEFLMEGKLAKSELGAFRQVPVTVGGRETVSWYLIPHLVSEWIVETYRRVSSPPEDLEEAFKKDHVTFEKIHPFIDGNGRMGRILMNWQRIKGGLPILIIKESEKSNYYDWF